MGRKPDNQVTAAAFQAGGADQAFCFVGPAISGSSIDPGALFRFRRDSFKHRAGQVKFEQTVIDGKSR